MTWDEQTHPDDPQDFPETPALVTVEQAQSDLAFYDRFESLTTLQAGIQRYAYTVASEPERTRAAEAAAWAAAVAWFASRGPLNGNARVSIATLHDAEEANPYRAESVENGADYA